MKKQWAIKLTSIGLNAGQEYSFTQDTVEVSVYSIISVDGSSFFVVFTDSGFVIAKKELDRADKAAYIFATTVWKLMGV